MIGASLLYGTVFGRIGVPNNKLVAILTDVRLGRRADTPEERSHAFDRTDLHGLSASADFGEFIDLLLVLC